MFSSIAGTPAKQLVGETITTLSGRLSTATLLEDRRAAILGLRSFAKDYPASVASGALRSLIGSLSRDGEDVDTVKVVLETLLGLFNPNPGSPEASDEIALWLADEFTQRQENITLLLDFLETPDTYSRLYSLQLLSAIHGARTERTEECITAAPLGISRLVAVLDDRREPVRNEAITLLTYLTPTSLLIQKSVAFESAFEKVFAIITAEGGLAEGDRIVEDCLILVANLLRLNPKNQLLFRETSGVQQLAKLLESMHKSRGEEEISRWAQQQRNRNVYALLAVIRLFLVAGAEGVPQNQSAFWQHGLLFHTLQLAFDRTAELPIRAEALTTCADTIRANPRLQESFAQLQVPSVPELAEASNGHRDGHTSEHNSGVNSERSSGQYGPRNGTAALVHGPPVFVIDGLLDLTLGVSLTQTFDLRLAACQCLKAYFFNHSNIREHFLKRAIEGHKSGADETANVLTTLMQSSTTNDAYRQWFAAVLMLHLLFDDVEAKALAMAVTDGDADKGEEVVTSIQTITAHLISGLGRAADERATVGYLMLLLGWLFEDMDAVNDFLGEGSNIQGLAVAAQDPSNSPLVQGLSAMLLGVVYEFSTKDSPIPRASLHSVITSRLTREQYINALNSVRCHPFMRDYEVIPQKLDPASATLPDVYFDATFVEFFKDNYSRILRAIDRDPGMEISVVTNGVQKGISRELVDSLRAQLDLRENKLQAALVDVTSLEQQLSQERAEHQRSKEASSADLGRIQAVNEALQRHHDDEIKTIQSEQRSTQDAYDEQLRSIRREGEQALEAARADFLSKEEELQRQLQYVQKTAQAETAKVQRRAEAGMADLRATISRLEVDLMKADKAKGQELHLKAKELRAKGQELDTLRAEHASELEAATSKAKKAEERALELEEEVTRQATEIQKTLSEVKAKDEEKAATQTELDDLLMVFGDLEEKVEKYKKRLVELNEAVSDAEEDDDDEEGNGEDEASVD